MEYYLKRMNLRPYQEEAITKCIEALHASDEPVLLVASVGAGKSIIMAHIINEMRLRSLSICFNKSIVDNNMNAFGQVRKQNPIPLLTPLPPSKMHYFFSTSQKLRRMQILSESVEFLIIDEAHAHGETNKIIYERFKEKNPNLKCLGVTGTNYKFNGQTIVGDDHFFKTQILGPTISDLIKENYLVKPIFSLGNDGIDFSSIKTPTQGYFPQMELSKIIKKNISKTEAIMLKLQEIMKNRFGVFIFATNTTHCKQCLKSLPENESAVITADTPVKERKKIIEKAKQKEIKYLINVNLLTVGIDIPAYDTICYVRPTESMVLFTQTLGRGLRLAPQKKDCLVLDFAGNIERHKDYDDPFIINVLQQHHTAEKIFPCPQCQTLNSIFASRCIGITTGKRCDFFFNFKSCPQCKISNSASARTCRQCSYTLIDPNAKLILNKQHIPIKEMTITCFGSFVRIMFISETRAYEEKYFLNSSAAQRYFYFNFLKKHFNNPSIYYNRLNHESVLAEIKLKALTPTHIVLNEKGKIIDKLFKARS